MNLYLERVKFSKPAFNFPSENICVIKRTFKIDLIRNIYYYLKEYKNATRYIIAKKNVQFARA